MIRKHALPGDDIVALVSLVMTGVALLSLGSFPARAIELEVLGTPLTILFSGRMVVSLLLILLTSAGMDAMVRGVSGQDRLDLRFSLSFWILPGLVTLAAVTAVPRQFVSAGGWVGAMLFLGGLLTLVVVAECGTISIDQPYYRAARLGLNIATYGAAMALYTTLYGLQERSLISSTAIILITFPLALELLRSTEEQTANDWLYAGVIALVIGQASWPLNALGLRALHGGALLLLLFYTVTGIAQQSLAGRLNRRVVLEFVALGTVLAAFIGISAWQTALAGRTGIWPAPASEYPSQSEQIGPAMLPGDAAQPGDGTSIDLLWPAPPVEGLPEGRLPEGLAPEGLAPVPARPVEGLDKP